MRKNYLYVTLLVGLISISTVRGQEQLTLQQAISIALANNYDIKLTKNDAEIAKNNNNLGNAGLLPMVAATLNTGGSRQNTVQTQASGTERRINGAQNSNLGYGVEILVKVRYHGDKDDVTFEQLEGRRYYLKELIEKIISTAKVNDIVLLKN